MAPTCIWGIDGFQDDLVQDKVMNLPYSYTAFINLFNLTFEIGKKYCDPLQLNESY